MVKKSSIKKEIIAAANKLALQGINPTLLRVREELGHGSSTTIHKHLTAWKLKCYQKGDQNVEPIDNENILEENHNLKQTLQQQTKNNEELTAELIMTEHNKTKLEITNVELQNKIKILKEKAKELAQEKEKYQSLYEMLTKDRQYTINEVLEDKNKVINSLKDELQEVNKANVEKIIKLGRKADDSLMNEKVKVVHLNDQLQEQKDLVKKLNLELDRNKETLISLKRELTKYKEMITELVSFEQLKEYEKKQQQAEFEGVV